MDSSARHHLAVVAGPDCGLVLPLLPGGAVIGRDTGLGLGLRDRYCSRRHLQLRERAGTVRLRDLGSANGTRVRLARGRSARLSRHTRRVRRWRVLPVGSRVHAGATVLELRRHPAMVHIPDHDEAGGIGEGLLGRLMLPLIMCGTTLPLLLRGGGAWRVVLMIALPVVLLVAILWPALRQRARRLRKAAGGKVEPERPEVRQPWADPAALLAGAGAPAGLPDDGPRWEIGNANVYAPRPHRSGAPLRGRRAAQAERMRWMAPPVPGSGLALVGPAEAVAGLARWLAVRHTLLTGEPLRSDWPDLAPLARPAGPTQPAAPTQPAGHAHPAGPAHPAGRTESADHAGDAADPPSLWLWQAGAADPDAEERAGYRHLVLAEHMSQVPGWCATLIDVHGDHDRRVGPRWSTAVAAALPPVAGVCDLPQQTHLSELLPPDLRGWQTPAMHAPLGVSIAGQLWVDLTEHGPHALVAGTTGAGKSELLLSWILGLAHHSAPADLSFVLFDYKGGATFTPLAELAHVVGVLTDLDEAITARALRSLQAELRARENALAAVGAHDIEEQRRRSRGPDRLGRLVVVVDEFRVMADAHPEQLDALVRLAAQGRSLGIHLILATQRPGGAITPDMRANLTLRLCLRVLEETDSMDMLGTAEAARLPRVPGRAIVRSETSTTVQTPWCGPADQGWIRQRVADLNQGAQALEHSEPWRRVRHRPWAPPLPEQCWAEDLFAEHQRRRDRLHEPSGAGPDAGPGTATDAALVATAGARPDAACGSRSDPADGDGAYALPWAQVDLPDEQRLGPWWPPGGILLVSGGPGSGRSTALHSLTESALHAGTVVHVLADGAEGWPGAAARAAGTWCGTDDPRRVRRLLHLLLTTPSAGLLIIDDVDAVAESLDEVGPLGDGADLVLTVLRRARRLGLDVALSADERSRRWAAVAGRHVLLCPRDATDAVIAGAPRDLVAAGWPPGRGVLLEHGTACVAQIALARPDQNAWRPPERKPLRLVRLPTDVVLPHPGTTGRSDRGRLGVEAGPANAAESIEVLLGCGGDTAQWLSRPMRARTTWAFCGPAGSGRSTALATVARQLQQQGWHVRRPEDLGRPTRLPSSSRGSALLVDDADRLTSATAQECAAWLRDNEAAVLVAAARPESLVTVSHPLAARLRDADLTVVLADPRPAHLPTVDLRGMQDPLPPPGRGVLVGTRENVPVQLARPDADHAEPPEADPARTARLQPG